MARYKALRRDADIDPEVALIQGALALDAAGEIAEKTNDVEGMLNVAAMWMKFGESIQTFAEKAEEDAEKAELKAREGEVVKSGAGKIEMGFQRFIEQPEPVIAEEEENVGIEDD